MSGAVPPVAIVGVGCRFPGANGPAEYWQLIKEGRCAVREVPPHRVELGFNVQDVYDPRPGVRGKIASPRYGFLDHPERFDPIAFGLTPRDAVGMEPQQRLVVEVVWDALQDAGIPPDSLEGERVAVMIGHMAEDYSREQIAVLGEERYRRSIDVWAAAGISRAAVSGRVSFLLGVRGPSLTVDTACSSSLLTVHLACQSLWSEESRLAIAGGVNVFLSPEGMIALSGVGMLARDGFCKAFDDRADGFVRAEGAGVVVLRPLADALQANDPIYAVIRGTGFSADGRDGGHMMAPGRHGQVQAMRDAYQRAALDPSVIDFVEAHGTGTPIGDPVEIAALADVMAPGRAADRPLRVSSVKGNIGHAEPASGIAGLIKAALAVYHRELPAQLHFETPSRAIPWDEVPIRVQAEHAPWPHSGPAYAAVNSFGISGTNAHAILEQAPAEAAARAHAPAEPDTAGLFVLSAHSREALRQGALDLARDVEQRAASGALSLRDLGYTLARRRSHRSHRLAVVAGSADALAAELQAWSRGEPDRTTADARCERSRAPRVGMVFSGHGAHWFGMGQRLLEQQPVFRAALEEFDAAQRRHVDWSLVDVLRAPAARSSLGRVDVVQSAVTGVAIGLARLWRAFGVEPACVVGHSVGEIAAAHTAGCIGLAEAARLACERGRAIRDHAAPGAMGVVALPAEALADELAERRERGEGVWLAGSNAPSTCIVSGEVAAVEALLCDLEARGEFARRLNVEYASHCPAMEAPGNALRAAVRGLASRSGRIPFVSTVTGGALDGSELGAHYWGRNLRAPVLLADAVGAMLDDGVELLVEVSAHPVLAAALDETAKARAPERAVSVIGTLRREEDEPTCLLASLGSAFTLGVPVAFDRLLASGRVVPTPLYPYQRREYWFGARRGSRPSVGTLVFAGLQGANARHDFSSREPGRSYWQIEIDQDAFASDNQIGGAAALPEAELVAIALQAAGRSWPEGAGALEDLRFGEPLGLPDGPRWLQVVVDAGEQSARVRIASAVRAEPGAAPAWSEHARLRVWRAVASEIDRGAVPAVGLGGQVVTPERFYEELAAQGHGREPGRRSVQRLWCDDDELLAAVVLPEEPPHRSALSRVVRHAVDASVQLLAWWGSCDGRDDAPAWSAAAIDEADLAGADELVGELYVRLRRRAAAPGAAGAAGSSGGELVADAEIFRRDCTRIGLLRGLRLRPARGAAARRAREPWLYRRVWRPQPWPAPAADAPGRWVVAGSDAGLRSQVARALRAAGQPASELASDAGEAELAAAWADTRGRVWAGPGDPLAEPLASATGEPPPPPWRVLRGAVRLPSEAGSADLAAATRFELATAGGERCIDVPEALSREQAERLAALLGSELAAGAWVLRGDELIAPRLVRFEPDARAAARALHRAAGEGFRASAPAADPALRVDPARVDPALVDPERVDPALVDPERVDPALVDPERVDPALVDRLDWVESVALPLEPDEVRLEVRAVGLCFLDVLASAGLAHGGGDELGWECAGVVTRVGSEVADFAPGDEVFGFARAALASHATTRAALLARKPGRVDFAGAAALPLAECVARHALDAVARLRAGERLVIHSAAGAIGQAALALAVRRGAHVLATAGSERRRRHLRQLGAAVLDSRAPQTVRALRDWTGSDGIDVVLDLAPGRRLADEDALAERLAPGARIVELDRPGRNRRAHARPGLAIHTIDPTGLLRDKPDELSPLLREVAAEVDTGALRPAAPTCFPLSQARRALRYLSQARHLGKVVVSRGAERPATLCPARVAATAWLRDAAVALHGRDTAAGRAVAGWLEAQGARVEPLGGGSQRDARVTASQWAGRAAAAAVVALDPFAPSQSSQSSDSPDWPDPSAALEAARSACTAAAWAGLEFVWLVTPDELGQGAAPGRAAARALAELEALAADAASLGLPVWRIRLARGASPGALAACWGDGGGSVALLDRSPDAWADWAGTAAAAHPWLAELAAAPGPPSDRAADPGLHARDPAERLAAVRAALAAALGRVLHLSDAVVDQLDWSRAPNDLGLDSLMAVELKLVLEARLGIDVGLAAFFDGTPLAELAQGMADRIGEGA